MLQQMAELKSFSHEELFQVLDTCASILAMAYQETLDKELDWASQQAFCARDYLLYEIQKQHMNRIIH